MDFLMQKLPSSVCYSLALTLFFSCLPVSANTQLSSDESLTKADPLYFKQWFFKGNSVIGDVLTEGIGVLSLEDLGLETNDNTIMLISFGINEKHEDLKNKLWTNTNEEPNDGIDNDLNGFVDDIHGINVTKSNGDISADSAWGTAIAGIISAESNNGVGIRGVSKSTDILTCKIDFNELKNNNDTFDAIDDCLNYAINQISAGTNIAAVISPFSIQPLFYNSTIENIHERYFSIIDKIERNNIIYIANNPVDKELDSMISMYPPDVVPFFPLYYQSPNIISASSMDREGFLQSSYGKGFTAWVAAEDILTTSSVSSLEQGNDHVFFDDAESSDLSLTGSWAITQSSSNSGSKSWYFPKDGLIGTITLPEIDLATVNTSELLFDVKVKKIKEKMFSSGDENPYYSDMGWIDFEYKVGNSLDWSSVLLPYWEGRAIWDDYSFSINLEKFGLKGDEKITFRINTIQTGNDIFIDDIRIGRIEDAIKTDGYFYWTGNDAATAILAGAVAKIKSIHPSWPAWRVTNAISTAGDSINYTPSYPYFSIQGTKTLMLTSSNQTGVFDCNNNILQKRLFPINNAWLAAMVNESFPVKVKSVNCSLPGEPYSYTELTSSETFTSVDDGKGIDAIANDGNGVISLKFSESGRKVLTNPNDDDFKLFVFKPYSLPRKIDFNWYNVKELKGDFSFWDNISFPVNIGDVGDVKSATHAYNGIFKFITTMDTAGNITDSNFSTENLLNSTAIEKQTNFNKNSKVHSRKEILDIIDNKSQTESTDYEFELLTNRNLPSSLVDRGFNHRISIFMLELKDAIEVPMPPGQARMYRPWVESSIIHIIGEAPNRKVVVNFKAYDFTRDDFSQLVFMENGSSIQFNFGELPPSFIGKETEIGIEIGTKYAQRMKITLASNTSYLMQVEGTPPNTLEFSLPTTINSPVIGSKVNLNDYIQSSGHENLKFEIVEGTESFSVNSLGVLTIPKVTNSDSIPLSIKVFDSTNTALKTTTVRFENTPPLVTFPEHFDLRSPSYSEFNLKNYVIDPEGMPVNYYIKKNNNWELIDDGIYQLRLTRPDKFIIGEQFRLDFKANDGVNDTLFSSNINLTYDNTSPSFYAGKQTRFDLFLGETSTIDLNEYFHDDDHDILNYISSTTGANINGKHLIFHSTNIGTYDISVSALDGFDGETTLSFQFNVKTRANTENKTEDSSSGGGSAGHSLFFIIIFFLFRRFNLDFKGKKSHCH
jgi:hypothetical protein